VIRHVIASSVVVFTLSGAPMQCGGGHGDDRHEDDAGDALWNLAQDFKAKGNHEAAKQTLRYLVEKYPSNRHAPAAREELGEAK
jgi:TolA-binding protein